MSEQNNSNQEDQPAVELGPPTDDTVGPQLGLPYEAVLLKAMDKLTSQILIFLIAYTILLIALYAYGPQMATWLRNLFYIIPVLGVGAYAWLRRRDIVKEADAKGIDIRAGIVRGSARLVGAQGVTGEAPENLKLSVGYADDQAEVLGLDYGGSEEQLGNLTKAMNEIYEKLDQDNQIKLLNSARRLLKKQEA